MMKVTSVKYMLMVQDMDRAVTFYRDIFGFEVRVSSPGWSELAHGDAIIALHGGGDGSDHDTGLAIEVEDIESAVKALAAGGAKILVEPRARTDEGILLANLRDPEGNNFSMSQVVGQTGTESE